MTYIPHILSFMNIWISPNLWIELRNSFEWIRISRIIASQSAFRRQLKTIGTLLFPGKLNEIYLLQWKKKSSHFDLKNWVTVGTKIRHGIPSNWRIFESNWLDMESQLTFNTYSQIDSILRVNWQIIDSQYRVNSTQNILQLLGIPGRILVPPVTQLFRSKWLDFSFQGRKKIFNSDARIFHLGISWATAKTKIGQQIAWWAKNSLDAIKFFAKNSPTKKTLFLKKKKKTSETKTEKLLRVSKVIGKNKGKKESKFLPKIKTHQQNESSRIVEPNIQTTLL